jgi:hypothetical protein
VADEVFEFDGVKCSVVKNAQWLEALETRNWSKHEIYGYNGYALFEQVPYLLDGIAGSLEDEAVFAHEIEAYGGVDLIHLDEHGWLCAFIASHDCDSDNPGRTDKSWIKEQIIEMVLSAKKQTRASRRLSVEAVEDAIGRNTSIEPYSIRAQEVFSLPCDWTDEVTGQLARAVILYLQGQQLSSRDVDALRIYLRQWIQSRIWDMNPHATIENRRALSRLRDSVTSIRSRKDIGQWLQGAEKLGLNSLP